MMLFSYPISQVKADGPPSPDQVFIDSHGTGHNFTENNWDIMSFNNSHWEVDDPSMDINNMTTWVNNTWNIKWISEGNFEMGFLAFMNKSGDENSAHMTAYTPGQYWWMHYYYQGHEMLIGNMLTAWFGFEDANHNRQYDDGESLTPYFYMTLNSSDFNYTAVPGLDAHTSVDVTPMTRQVEGSKIIYSWAYNYSDICFYVPKVNHTNHENPFQWGFEYQDPGKYMDGSSGFGVQDFIYYRYTLTLDSSLNKVTLQNDYISGDIKKLYLRDDNSSSFTLTSPTNPKYIPNDWALCVGNWAFIMAGVDRDYEFLDTTGSAINTNITNHGLTTVSAVVTGTKVFDYDFSQKTNYTQYENGNPSNHTSNSVLYQSVAIEGNDEFLKLVSGMSDLIGGFAHLMISYAINETNHFVNGIPFEDAWDIFDPNDTAALFVSCYPEFGEYKGGRIEHDPTFTAFWTPGTTWGQTSPGIPSYPLASIGIFAAIGVIYVVHTIKKKKYQWS